MVVVVEGEVCYSDSDSDDDDVDRYVFLARQPAPAAGHRHAEDDRGASSVNDEEEDNDGDGEATADEEEPERGGGRRRKRRPLGREILDDGAPPPPSPPKKARPVELIAPPIAHTPPSGSGSETESDSAALPCVDARAGESGSEGSHDHEKKVHRGSAPGRRGEAKNAKRVTCGKRGRDPGCEADGDRVVTVAAKAGAPPAATSGRFLCNMCERCFGSYQALGGHVLGHRKKARIAIAAATGLDDVGDAGGVIGNCKEETAVVEANNNGAASGIALQEDKMVAVAVRRGKANGSGGGGCHDKMKTVYGVAEHRDDDVAFGNEGDGISVSSHGLITSNGGNSRSNGRKGIGAAVPNQKVIAGSCHEGATANGDVDGVRRTTLYKCKVCGTECPTGRALGGHMRKHLKRPPLGGGREDGRSPSPTTDDDCQIPLARLFAAENTIGLI
jgi:hypothetical protein